MHNAVIGCIRKRRETELIGDNIKKYRELKGLSIATLAAETGIDIAGIEDGRVELSGVGPALIAIRMALGVTLDELVNDD